MRPQSLDGRGGFRLDWGKKVRNKNKKQQTNKTNKNGSEREKNIVFPVLLTKHENIQVKQAQ